MYKYDAERNKNFSDFKIKMLGKHSILFFQEEIQVNPYVFGFIIAN